ncbi:MAG: hypothetical protein IPP40_09125 [bacterium]|nr:hypothetical protein [bacterium]
MKKSVFAAITLLCLIVRAFAAEGTELSQDDMMKKWMEIASPGPNREMLTKRSVNGTPQ